LSEIVFYRRAAAASRWTVPSADREPACGLPRRQQERFMTCLADRPIPIIDLRLCDGCGLCARACPNQALTVRDGKAIIADPLACEYDGLCELVCPARAITRPFEIVIAEGETQPSNSTKVVEKYRPASYNADDV
jgi:NAD-dependent dihydropyrimidine dehydrogenase PreA subunit